MIDRRSILRGALFGAGMSAFSQRVLGASTRALRSAGPVHPATTPDKVLFVFLRGGNDGANTLIPYGDPTYTTARPLLQIPQGSALALPGVSFSKLNPNLYRLLPVFQAGHLAFVHQAGDPTASRSHFYAMDAFETGCEPGTSLAALAAQTGFVHKVLGAVGAPPLANGKPAALSISLQMQKMFRAGASTQLSAHVRSLQKELLKLPTPIPEVAIAPALAQNGLDHFNNPTTTADQLLGANLAFGMVANGGLEALQFDHATQFAATQRFPTTAGDLSALAQVLTGQDLASLPTHDPKGEAFMGAAEQAVFALLNLPELRIAGVEFGGWDTHDNQNQPHEHPNLLRYLGWALRDLHDAIQAAGLGDKITVITVTEFGRTAKENASLGTDHGAGGVMKIIGNRVTPGTCGCHGGSPTAMEYGPAWRNLLDPAVLPGTPFYDACDVRVPLRDVLAEVFHAIFGVPLAGLGNILPNYPASSAGFFGLV